MPTWPTVKGSTTHLDSGNDNPGEARPSLKQTTDNVNDMIDTIVVTSPTDGQALVYNSSTSRFENTTQTGQNIAFLGIDGTINATSNDFDDNFAVFTHTSDPSSILDVATGNDRFTLSAGTYYINAVISGHSPQTYDFNVRLNEGGGSLISLSATEISTDNYMLLGGLQGYTTISTPTVYSFQTRYISGSGTKTILDPPITATQLTVGITVIKL